MVHGYSSSSVMQIACSLFSLLRAALETDMWVEFVYTDANIADIPSRNRGAGHADEAAFKASGIHLVPHTHIEPADWASPPDLYSRIRRQ